MVHIGKQLPIHLLHLWPIGAVHVGDVEIVALVTPAFVKDLSELQSWIQIHPQRHIEVSLPGLRRIAIGID